jgi:hypothetical protein
MDAVDDYYGVTWTRIGGERSPAWMWREKRRFGHSVLIR